MVTAKQPPHYSSHVPTQPACDTFAPLLSSITATNLLPVGDHYRKVSLYHINHHTLDYRVLLVHFMEGYECVCIGGSVSYVEMELHETSCECQQDNMDVYIYLTCMCVCVCVCV